MIATVVWTYWLAFPLLTVMVVAVVGMAWLYYRRVLVAKYERIDYQQSLAPRRPATGEEATVVALAGPRTPSAISRRAA